jgi:excisionase family DNA binding protein
VSVQEGLVGVYTVSEVAQMTKMSEWAIRRQIADGHLHAKRIGRCVRVTAAELNRWLEDTEA